MADENDNRYPEMEQAQERLKEAVASGYQPPTYFQGVRPPETLEEALRTLKPPFPQDREADPPWSPEVELQAIRSLLLARKNSATSLTIEAREQTTFELVRECVQVLNQAQQTAGGALQEAEAYKRTCGFYRRIIDAMLPPESDE